MVKQKFGSFLLIVCLVWVSCEPIRYSEYAKQRHIPQIPVYPIQKSAAIDCEPATSYGGNVVPLAPVELPQSPASAVLAAPPLPVPAAVYANNPPANAIVGQTHVVPPPHPPPSLLAHSPFEEKVLAPLPPLKPLHPITAPNFTPLPEVNQHSVSAPAFPPSVSFLPPSFLPPSPGYETVSQFVPAPPSPPSPPSFFPINQPAAPLPQFPSFNEPTIVSTSPTFSPPVFTEPSGPSYFPAAPSHPEFSVPFTPPPNAPFAGFGQPTPVGFGQPTPVGFGQPTPVDCTPENLKIVVAPLPPHQSLPIAAPRPAEKLLPVPAPLPAPAPLPTLEPLPVPVPVPVPAPAPLPVPEPLPISPIVPAPEPCPAPLPVPEPSPAPHLFPLPVPEPSPAPHPFPLPAPSPPTAENPASIVIVSSAAAEPLPIVPAPPVVGEQIGELPTLAAAPAQNVESPYFPSATSVFYPQPFELPSVLPTAAPVQAGPHLTHPAPALVSPIVVADNNCPPSVYPYGGANVLQSP